MQTRRNGGGDSKRINNRSTEVRKTHRVAVVLPSDEGVKNKIKKPRYTSNEERDRAPVCAYRVFIE